ncbi:Glycerol kinase [Poriferisphaera corsica]|uniref:Glycerol kinase n=1 Tax=Poriferisphaera corsica TaxID=2528020 RepID=A0A517YT39_9BACT|nr:glycerol kinase GlpK [Poriferisphaera corsica]QDU33396.1 Glycerol kinase [Poriferisphaera corsica]
MSNKFIIALDQGTTSSRAILFDHQGKIHSVAQKEFAQHYPKAGWVEHDADEIWSSQVSVASEAIARAQLTTKDIDSIGITNQRETTVLWNRKTGKPIHNAIVWQDRRTAEFCQNLVSNGHEETFTAKTGLRLDPYFSGTKITWILDNVKGARELAEAGDLAFGTVDSWLIWNLTGGDLHITDPTNASRTLLFNIHTGEWDQELLDILNIPASVLPVVKESSEIYGTTSGNNLGSQIPIAGIAGDQQAALFGQMCIEPGMIKSTYGTGCFMLINTGDQAITTKNNLLTTVAWKINGKTTYALEGSVFIGGAVVQWLRDELGIIKSSADIEAKAAAVKDSGDVYLVPAFAGLGAPHWDPYARGLIVGITRGTSANHICRAALESICFQVDDVLYAMKSDSEMAIPQMRVDGGATVNNLLMQLQTDILGIPVVRPQVQETTALGAAYLAGLATGFWKDIDEIQSQWAVDREFKPEMSEEDANKKRQRWLKALNRAKQWADD